MTKEEAELQFSEWLASQDYGEHEIPADGEWHNFALPDDRDGKKHGSAKLVFGDRIEGVFKDWRNQTDLKRWTPNGASANLTDEDRQAAANERKRRKREKKEAQDKARKEALNLYAVSPAAPLDHPYLVKKAIKSINQLKIDKKDLLVPIYNARTDEFQTVQRIKPDGFKLFPPDAVTTGGYHLVGRQWPRGKGGRQPIVICEGYATGYAIHVSALLENFVISAMGSGNLKAVATALRARFPLPREIIIAADNDDGDNPGVKAATEAALLIDAKLAVLPIPPKADFWDLWNQQGDAAVKKCIEGATEPKDDSANTTKVASDQIGENAPAFSEEALALDFAQRHADDLRHVAQWGKWYRWDGSRWEEDKTRKVFDLSRSVCREAATRTNKSAHGKAIASARTRAAVVSLASDDRRLAATVEQWDAEPWLLNTPEGIIDLRTGKTRKAEPKDYMTMMTAVAPGGECLLWHKFLETVTGGDSELQKFLQVACGYALTGSTREQILLFLHGKGQNGKTVFIETISNVLGDYHTTAPMETFVDSIHDRHPTELAGLRGARLVTAAETEQGRRWAESKIKNLTGGDKIRARFMRQDFFTYVPQFTLMVYGNYKPGLKSVDDAIRRRIKLIPFTVRIKDEDRDNDLGEKLKAEWPGILAWMIEGCLIWQREGLVAPKVVESATESYLATEDAVGRWIDECCELDPQASEAVAKLYNSWSGWATRYGEFIGSGKRFSQMLADRGFEATKVGDNKDRAGYIGLKVALDAPPPPPPPKDDPSVPF